MVDLVSPAAIGCQFGLLRRSAPEIRDRYRPAGSGALPRTGRPGAAIVAGQLPQPHIRDLHDRFPLPILRSRDDAPGGCRKPLSTRAHLLDAWPASDERRLAGVLCAARPRPSVPSRPMFQRSAAAPDAAWPRRRARRTRDMRSRFERECRRDTFSASTVTSISMLVRPVQFRRA